MTECTSAPQLNLDDALQLHLTEHPERISRLEHRGKFYWVKQKEQLSLRMRLQKGNAADSFETERKALHHLKKIHAPVPEIVKEGPGYFVLPDSGDNLQQILRNTDALPDTRRAAFAQAGKALADLHNKGISHGRPAIRDFCWRAPKIILLDFERFSEKRANQKGQLLDLVIFTHSALAAARGITPELRIALDAYRARNTSRTWEAAADYCARLTWLNWITKPAQWRKDGKAKEFKAIPMVLDLFAGRPVTPAPAS